MKDGLKQRILTERNKIPHLEMGRAYSARLDCLFEMSRDMAEGNGISYEEAVKFTLESETSREFRDPSSKDVNTVLKMLKEAV